MDGKVVLITGANTGIGGALRLRRLGKFDTDQCKISFDDHHKQTGANRGIGGAFCLRRLEKFWHWPVQSFLWWSSQANWGQHRHRWGSPFEWKALEESFDSDHYHCNIHIHDHHKKDKPWMLIFQVLKPPKTFIKEELRFIYSAGSNMLNAKHCWLSGQEQACSRITQLVGCFVITLQKKY